MRRLLARLLPAIACLTLSTNVPSPADAETIVADLSQSRVAITASFAGSRILVFGAVSLDPGQTVPELAYPLLDPLSVIVTVSGPSEPVTVRKKARRAGIWVNAKSMEVDRAPTFYKIATSGPLAEILSQTEDLRYRISIDKAIQSIGGTAEVKDTAAFVEALIRLRMDAGLYELKEQSVHLADQTLFRADIDLPSNLVEGKYTTRIFLTRNTQVVAEFSRVLDVRKVGIERWIYTLAQEQALVYGIMSLAIAIAAGWGASAVFRYAKGH